MKVDVGSETYDAFTDVDTADIYLGADVARAAGWALASPDGKGRGLVSATRQLMGLPWCVVPAPLPTDAVIPQALADATAMLAADIVAKPRLFADASSNSNIKNVKAGSASVEFFSPVRGAPPLPLSIWNMLVAAGLVGCTDGDSTGTPFVSGIMGAECRPLGGWYATDDCRDYD